MSGKVGDRRGGAELTSGIPCGPTPATGRPRQGRPVVLLTIGLKVNRNREATMRKPIKARPPGAAPPDPPSDRALTPVPPAPPHDEVLETRVRAPFPAAADTDAEC